jgi:uncharacterized protein (DUF488 family)
MGCACRSYLSAEVAYRQAGSGQVRSTLSGFLQGDDRGTVRMATIYTIGYEGTDIDGFVATLRAADVQMLVDVRALPLSRKRGFSKAGLRTRLKQEGIVYFHMKELGNPKAGRDAARAGRHDEWRRIYAQHLLGEAPARAMIIVEALAKGMPICLMCFERDPATCHRSVITEGLQSVGLSALHLLGDEPSRYVGDPTKLSRRGIGEGAAAA